MQTFKLSEKKSDNFNFGIRRYRYHKFNVYYIFKSQYYYKLITHNISDERINDYTHKMLHTYYT